jgi:hypothetical protein
MKTTKELVPAVLELFKAQVAPLKGASATVENIERAAALIAAYIMRLQILDLSLSESDARALLKQTYQSI